MRALKSIMLVDDDSTTNFLHELVIQEMDLAVDIVIALDGKDALEKLHDLCYLDNKCPDLILLDINMPCMDGFEFLQEFNDTYLHENPPVVVIMVTSSSNSDDIKKAVDLKVKDYLSKPLDKEGLKKIVKQYFN